MGKGKVRSWTTAEKLLDIQRSEWERQLTKEVGEPDGSAGGSAERKLRGDTGLWLWAGPFHPEVLGANFGHSGLSQRVLSGWVGPLGGW